MTGCSASTERASSSSTSPGSPRCPAARGDGADGQRAKDREERARGDQRRACPPVVPAEKRHVPLVVLARWRDDRDRYRGVALPFPRSHGDADVAAARRRGTSRVRDEIGRLRADGRAGAASAASDSLRASQSTSPAQSPPAAACDQPAQEQADNSREHAHPRRQVLAVSAPEPNPTRSSAPTAANCSTPVEKRPAARHAADGVGRLLAGGVQRRHQGRQDGHERPRRRGRRPSARAAVEMPPCRWARAAR